MKKTYPLKTHPGIKNLRKLRKKQISRFLGIEKLQRNSSLSPEIGYSKSPISVFIIIFNSPTKIPLTSCKAILP